MNGISKKREDLGAEFPHGDMLQLALPIPFLVVWCLDSFVYQFSTVLAGLIPIAIRLICAVVLLGLAFLLMGLSHQSLFGEIRDPPTVLDTGVFVRVRHPMYLGTLLMHACMGEREQNVRRRERKIREILENRKWQFLSLVLAIALVVSISFNIYQITRAHGGASEQINFTFTWGPDAQNVVNGTLRLDVTFLSWQKNDTSIIIRINDDDYHEWNLIAFADDHDHDGVIHNEATYVFYANNLSQPAILAGKKCGLLIANCRPEPGVHTVTFDDETGYTFRFQWPYDNFTNPLHTLREGEYNLMRICFSEGVWSSTNVYVEFSFYLPEA